MFNKRTRKQIEELLLYKEKTNKLNSELDKVKSERNSLSKLFSSIFHRYTIGSVKKLTVDKPDDFNNVLKLWFNDGCTYEYEIRLVKQGYEEEFNLNKNKGE